MPRGHNKKEAMSAVKWAARKTPKANHGKLRPKPTTVKDERASQRLVPKRTEVAPEWAKLKKSDYEKIPGTRIQCVRGGIGVRVILEDRKEFPPHKVQAAKRHLRKLAEKAKEKAEIARMLSSKEVVSVTGNVAQPEESQTSSTSSPAVSSAVQPNRSTAEPGSKKARKEAAWRERQQKLAEAHAAKVLEDCRELISQRWYEGEVVQRDQGKAWVRLSDLSEVAESELARLRANGTEIGVGGEVLPVCFADTLDKTLDLRPGVSVQFKFFKDRHGVGGCEVKQSSKRSAMEELETESDKKRSKPSPEPQTAQENVVAEGAPQSATSSAAKAEATSA